MLKILQGDALTKLRELPDESFHCCVTSPPFWGLRDYGCEGQLGLEKTPEEYVDKMVEVFREVRRVLRKDGTLWLNLGDSYAGSLKGANGDGTWQDRSNCKQGTNHGSLNIPPVKAHEIGLKPKDLCGIPWRVAFALQQPYYTGKIKNEKDRIWLAAMIDGEGCMFIHKRKTGQSNGQGYFRRKKDSFGAGLEVANTHREIVERCLAITGRGSICTVERESKLKNRNIPLHRWNLRSNECREVIREIYPHLVGKQHEARLVLGCPSSGPQAEAAHAGLMNLHNGRPCEIDFPAPESLYEQGWFLRQDNIWSKLNPMPESVTDRCTKSHEYLFLLTRSPRYFYDSEAIKEQQSAPERYNSQLLNYENDRKNKYGEGRNAINPKTLDNHRRKVLESGDFTRNKRSVWTVATAPYPEAHFATYPPDLIKPCILAGTSAKGCCAKCGAPWERMVESSKSFESGSGRSGNIPNGKQDLRASETNSTPDIRLGPVVSTKTIGWQPTCECEAGIKPCTVLDCFAGSGTTGAVALELGRKAILIELNPKYIELIEERCSTTVGLPLA